MFRLNRERETWIDDVVLNFQKRAQLIVSAHETNGIWMTFLKAIRVLKVKMDLQLTLKLQERSDQMTLEKEDSIKKIDSLNRFNEDINKVINAYKVS